MSNLSDIGHFTGTCGYCRYSQLFPDVLLTDGAKYVADTAGAYWLMDLIAGMLYENRVRDLVFVKLKLTGNGRCTVTMMDDDPPRRLEEKVTDIMTDFPEDITLFVNAEGEHKIIYLPSEH